MWTAPLRGGVNNDKYAKYSKQISSVAPSTCTALVTAYYLSIEKYAEYTKHTQQNAKYAQTILILIICKNTLRGCGIFCIFCIGSWAAFDSVFYNHDHINLFCFCLLIVVIFL